MGAWALPNTKQKAEKLKLLLSKPLYSNSKTRSELYHIYGDDNLFDDIDDCEYDYGTRYDVRFVVKRHIKGLLNYYKESPERFYVKFQKGALKILEGLVKDIS